MPLLPAAQAESFPQTTLPFVLRELAHRRQGVGYANACVGGDAWCCSVRNWAAVGAVRHAAPPCCLLEGPGPVVGVLSDGLVMPVEDGAKRWRTYFVERSEDWPAQPFAEPLDERIVVVAGILRDFFEPDDVLARRISSL
jgi:hypothetical protein